MVYYNLPAAWAAGVEENIAGEVKKQVIGPVPAEK